MSFSRLANHDKLNLIKQALMFFLGGCCILALFVFGLLPVFTRMLMKNTQVSKLPTATPPVVINPPLLYLPNFTATYSAQIIIKGKANPNLHILLGTNGSIDQKSVATGSGEFSFENVILNKGDNSIVAYAEDSDGNRSNGSNTINIAYTTDLPKLEIATPADGTQITQRKQSVVTLKGQTDPGNKVYLNDQFLFVGSDGVFLGSLQLQTGDNLLHIRAINVAGNETVKDLHVKYLP